MRGTQILVLSARDAIGQRSETVRRSNLSAIVRELHLRGPLSRSELGVLTGLTRSAIRGLIGELVGADLVREMPSLPAGTPGRPSPQIQPDPHGAVVLAFEVNVDSLAAAHVGFGGVVHELIRVDRPRGHLSVEAIVGDLTNLAGPLIGPLRGDPALVGVGVGVAGIVRQPDGLVRHAPNLGWRDVPLRGRLEAAFRLGVPITLGNEADLGGLAEHRRGAAAGTDTLIYITGEVGVGGNVLIAGRPLVGAAGYAGEVGHIPVNPTGVPCGCGSVGCWETEIGERAMLLRAGRAPDGGRAAVGAVIAAARAGEPHALAAMEHVGTWLGIGLAGLVNVFNPTFVVLGGLFERIHPLVVARVERVLDQRALAASRELVTVVPASLGIDAPVLGAAELAFEPLLADPAARMRGPRFAAASA
jgi:predicted NBD/HSP70 family sugar kinase